MARQGIVEKSVEEKRETNGGKSDRVKRAKTVGTGRRKRVDKERNREQR